MNTSFAKTNDNLFKVVYDQAKRQLGIAAVEEIDLTEDQLKELVAANIEFSNNKTGKFVVYKHKRVALTMLDVDDNEVDRNSLLLEFMSLLQRLATV